MDLWRAKRKRARAEVNMDEDGIGDGERFWREMGEPRK